MGYATLEKAVLTEQEVQGQYKITVQIAREDGTPAQFVSRQREEPTNSDLILAATEELRKMDGGRVRITEQGRTNHIYLEDESGNRAYVFYVSLIKEEFSWPKSNIL